MVFLFLEEGSDVEETKSGRKVKMGGGVGKTKS